MSGDLTWLFAEILKSEADKADVRSFLDRHPDATPEQRLKVILFDQRQCWNCGMPRSAEDYLRLFPEVNDDPSLKLQLIVGEFRASQDSGGKITAADLVFRFPELATQIGAELSRLDLTHRYPLPPVAFNSFFSDSTQTEHKSAGRYQLLELIGEGAFGQVWRAFDQELKRRVAVKRAHPDRLPRPEDTESLMQEAQVLAGLKHPNIVCVLDVGRSDGRVYFVCDFVDGKDLAKVLKTRLLEFREAAELIATVASALHYAHTKGLIHRDIKPSNLLIEEATQKVFVADFGLAVRENDDAETARLAGTPGYMSPEQVRGENHRIDARCDVFALGAVLYELLTGTPAFRGSTKNEVLSQVVQTDPKSPRQVNGQVPTELERICLKALSKRASDRYATAQEMADDLNAWLSPAGSVKLADMSVSIVPRGLRSFDASDAHFFLSLLPGPYNRDGLPESIVFWKQRVEESVPEKSFAVGLMYGPSGCGKSSLIKAGLIPCLSRNIVTIYVEATADDTETRVLQGLRNRIPELSQDQNLVETLAGIRRGRDRKVILFIDQFEQWLHAHRTESEPELVTALRQCDGARLQAIVMVRDDFWLAVSRFMDQIEIELNPGVNIRLVDLFGTDHARKVLTRIGQAYEKIATTEADLSIGQREFLTKAVEGLSEDGRVVSVRLALFGEMVKGKSWQPETLTEMGGSEGVGIAFLEETFSSRFANPRHRRHQHAARAVLSALLPEPSTDIKGHMRSQQELQTAAGLEDRAHEFTDLLRILDSELRLITPTDPEGDNLSGERQGVSPPCPSPDATPSSSPSALRYYQLTHDYLVPSLREWLTRKQKETRKGRAELKLEERTALWTAKPENRHLPSLQEWISIRWLTETKRCTAAQRSVMNRAARIHGLRTGITVLGIGLIIAAALGLNRQADERRNQAEATRLVEGLLAANTAKVSDSLASLKPFRRWANAQLQQEFQEAASESDAKLHAGLALLSKGNQVDPAVLNYLQEQLLTVAPSQIGPVRALMVSRKSELIPDYWVVAKDTAQQASLRFRAACALAGFDADSSEWKNPELTASVADQLVAVSPEYIGEFKELLRPVAPQLLPALSTIFKDPNRSELTKKRTTSLLADYAAKDPDTLAELILAADVVSDKSLFPLLQQHQTTAVKNLESVLAQRLEPDWKDAPLDPTWTEPSPAIRAQIESAHGMISDRFAFCQDMPLATFLELAETLRKSGYRPTRVRPNVERLSSIVQNPVAPASDPEPSQAQQTQSQEKRERLGQSLYDVAAIWTRDSKRWHIDPSLKPSDLPGPDALASKDGLLLADIAPLPLADETAESQFIALWSEPASADEQRRVLLDFTEEKLATAHPVLSEEGFASQCTISVRVDTNGQRRYTATWSNQGADSEVRPLYPGFELVHKPQWDVAVFPESELTAPAKLKIASIWRAEGDIPYSVFVPAGDMRWNEVKPAGEIFKFEEVGNGENTIELLDQNRGFRFRLGPNSAEIAAGDGPFGPWASGSWVTIEECAELPQIEDPDPEIARQAFLRMMPHSEVVSAAWRGDHEKAIVEFDSALLSPDRTADEDFSWACAAAIAALTPNTAEDARERYEDFAITWLTRAIDAKGDLVNKLRSDERLSALHTNSRFLKLLAQFKGTSRRGEFAAIWRADVEYESKLLAGVPVENMLDQLKPFIAEGWRPFAIAVDASGGARSAPSSALPGTFSPDLGGEGIVGNSGSSASTTVPAASPSTVPSPPGKGEKVADRPDERRS